MPHMCVCVCVCAVAVVVSRLVGPPLVNVATIVETFGSLSVLNKTLLLCLPALATYYSDIPLLSATLVYTGLRLFFGGGEEGEDPGHPVELKFFRTPCRDVIWDSLLLLLLIHSYSSNSFSYSFSFSSNSFSYSFSHSYAYSSNSFSFSYSPYSFNSYSSCPCSSSFSSFCSCSCSCFLLSYLLIASLVQREFLSC